MGRGRGTAGSEVGRQTRAGQGLAFRAGTASLCGASGRLLASGVHPPRGVNSRVRSTGQDVPETRERRFGDGGPVRVAHGLDGDNLEERLLARIA